MSFEIITSAFIGSCVLISATITLTKLHEIHKAVAYLYRFLNDPEGYMHKIQSLVAENYELTTKLEKLEKSILEVKKGEQK